VVFNVKPQKECLLCVTDEVVVYSEVKRDGRRQPASQYQHQPQHQPQPAASHPARRAAAAASNTEVNVDDDDSDVGPELPPKLDISQLTNGDQQQPVIIIIIIIIRDNEAYS